MIFILIFINLLSQSLPKFKKSLYNLYIYRLNFVGLFLALLLVVNTLNVQSIGSGISLFSGFIQISLTNQFIEIFIYLIGSLILIPLIDSFTISNNRKGSDLNNISLSTQISPLKDLNINHIGTNWLSYYPLIILFNLLGASSLISSFDLLFMYISIELQSFSLYILSTLNRDSVQSTSAGLRYFLIGGFASCLILLGIGLVYSSTGLTQFESLSILLTNIYNTEFYTSASLGLDTTINLSNYSFSKIGLGEGGLILILIGFLIKLGAAPLHQWAPDVYDKVPTKVTTWLVLIPKLSIFLFLFEFLSAMQPNMTNISSIVAPFTTDIGGVTNILLISSLISLIIGSLVGLSQVRIKRLLAFSAISHIGFLLLALSINTEIAIESFFFYLLQYTLTNLNIFVILLVLGNILNTNFILSNSTISTPKLNKVDSNVADISYINELKGIFTINPILSLSLAVSLFSMAGVPPLIGFFGKQQVLYSAISSGYIFISLIAISMSVISAYYYLKVIKVSHFSNSIISGQSIDLSSTLILKETGPTLQNNLLNSQTLSSNNRYTDILYNFIYSILPSLKDNSNNDTNIKTGINLVAGNFVSFLISVLTLILILFIVKPNLFLNSIHILALNLFYI